MYLGVHWLFDGFAQEDGIANVGKDGQIALRPIKQVKYAKTGNRTDGKGNVIATNLPIGGVPLGLAIADQIYVGGMKRSPIDVQPPAIQHRYAGGGRASVMLSLIHI